MEHHSGGTASVSVSEGSGSPSATPRSRGSLQDPSLRVSTRTAGVVAAWSRVGTRTPAKASLTKQTAPPPAARTGVARRRSGYGIAARPVGSGSRAAASTTVRCLQTRRRSSSAAEHRPTITRSAAGCGAAVHGRHCRPVATRYALEGRGLPHCFHLEMGCRSSKPTADRSGCRRPAATPRSAGGAHWAPRVRPFGGQALVLVGVASCALSDSFRRATVRIDRRSLANYPPGGGPRWRVL